MAMGSFSSSVILSVFLSSRITDVVSAGEINKLKTGTEKEGEKVANRKDHLDLASNLRREEIFRLGITGQFFSFRFAEEAIQRGGRVDLARSGESHAVRRTRLYLESS